MFNWIRKIRNNFRKAQEQEDYSKLERRYNDKYDRRGSYGKVRGPDTKISHEHNGFYRVVMDDQQKMIDNEVLSERYTEDYELSDIFYLWCDENLNGYYKIHTQEGQNGQRNQVYSGTWYIDIHCMRAEDAMALKLRFS